MKIFRMNTEDYVSHNSYDDAVHFYKDITQLSVEINDEYKNEQIELNNFKIDVNPELYEEPIIMTVEEASGKGISELPAIYFGRF